VRRGSLADETLDHLGAGAVSSANLSTDRQD
jgi:hypothetical protein